MKRTIIFYQGDVVDLDTGTILSEDVTDIESAINSDWYQEMGSEDKKAYISFLKTLIESTSKQVTEENQDLLPAPISEIDTEKDHFVLYNTFSTDLFKSMDTATEFKVFLSLIKYIEFNEGKVALNKVLRKKILDDLNMTEGYLSVVLKKLRHKGLIKGARGSVIINPFVVWYGNVNVRRVRVKMWYDSNLI